MDVDDAFLRKLALEIAEIRLELATMREWLIQAGADPRVIDQAIDLVVESPELQRAAQEVFERLRAPL